MRKKRREEEFFKLLGEGVIFLISYWKSYDEVMNLPVNVFFRVMEKIQEMLKIESSGLKL